MKKVYKNINKEKKKINKEDIRQIENKTKKENDKKQKKIKWKKRIK